MNNLKCYEVTCIDNECNEYVVGVMTADEMSAKHSAEYSLLEGKHIKAKAVEAREVERI